MTAQTATDGTGGNSPFARSLATRIDQPGLAIQLLGGLVRDDVMAATNNAQRPFVSASITGTPVYLSNLAAVTATKDVPLMEGLAWQGALNTNSRSAYEDYLGQFPKGHFFKLAKQNIKRLATAEKDNPAPAPAATLQYAALAKPGEPEPLAMSTPDLARLHAEDAGAVAALNKNVQAHNDAILLQNRVARDAYQSELSSVDERTRRDQVAYAKQVADFQAEQERWRERVRACENKDVDRCARSADVPKGRKLNPSEVLTWHEALILCKPSTDAAVLVSACQGPLWSGPVLLGSADGDALLVKACGTEKGEHDLGVSGGMRVFGCGYGIHPEDKDGTRPGNADLAGRLGVEMVAGRAEYHCPRKTTTFCRTS